jgi:hypothetical protein
MVSGPCAGPCADTLSLYRSSAHPSSDLFHTFIDEHDVHLLSLCDLSSTLFFSRPRTRRRYRDTAAKGHKFRKALRLHKPTRPRIERTILACTHQVDERQGYHGA